MHTGPNAPVDGGMVDVVFEDAGTHEFVERHVVRGF
jgi:hypothetical protein